MYRYLERRLVEHLREFLRRTYGLEIAHIVVEQPPKIEFGEYALPLAFELARKLRKAPRKIAEEIVAGIGPVPGFETLEVAGGGYINVRVNRVEVVASLTADQAPEMDVPQGKVLVEHTSINPNKAAHIGHLRNAILGDTFVRLLRFAGREVDVQNYIDNTGVQVADVVVGFLHIEQKSLAQIEALAAVPRFDYVCWDLYARVSQWYEEDKGNLAARAATLHAIEQGMEKESEQESERYLQLTGEKDQLARQIQVYRRGGFHAVLEWKVDVLKRKAAKEYVPATEFVDAYATLGRKEETILYLEKSYRERAPRLVFLQSNPAFDFLHSDPRYRAIVNKMGLAPTY